LTLKLPSTKSVVFLALLMLPGAAVSSDTETAEERLPIVLKYVDATHAQQEAMKGVEMEVDIEAKIPSLEKHGRLRALRKISRLGVITYKALGFSGDNTVKQEVITRYLAAESEGRENGSIAISPANYKFKLKSEREHNGRRIVVLQITPRKKAIGLFRGELWVDAETGMPVRESGQFVKSPSVFLKKIAFIRDYDIQDGVSIPAHIESMVDTRVAGRAELQISFSNFTRQVGEDEAAGAQANP
jgi:hypothetical protein